MTQPLIVSPRTRGLDVSYCQDLIDWKQVPDDIEFVIVKVAEAEYGKDPMRAQNMAGARATNRIIGVYEYLHPGDYPILEAKNLWDATGDTMPGLPPMLDLEQAPNDWTPDTIVQWWLQVARLVKSQFGRPSLTYTFPYFEKTRIAPAITPAIAEEVRSYRLCMADYSGGENPPPSWKPFTPYPWSEDDWLFAQVSGNNSSFVPGIGGGKCHVDHMLFNGDSAALLAYAQNG